MKLSKEKQEIRSKYQPKLDEINKRRHEPENVEEYCKQYTELVEKRNQEMDSVN